MEIFLLWVILGLITVTTGEDCSPSSPCSRIRRANKGEKFFCFEDIGCIILTSDWFNKTYRPVNLDPLPRHVIKTSFLIFSLPETHNERDQETLNYREIWASNRSVADSNYNANLNLVVLIHDFTSNGYTGWVKHLATVLLVNYKTYNVISIDWQGGAEPPYAQAVVNSRVVALELIHFLKLLIASFHLTPINLHLIGHGIGAHIAGYVGAEIRGIGRITGLDPSGPYFQHMPCMVKLDISDGLYVEIFHTDHAHKNDYTQGTHEELGHVDFYFNGDKKQPGCNDTHKYASLTKVNRNDLPQGTIYPGCSHKRAFKYLIEAVSNTDCEMIGFMCGSFNDLIGGHCSSCTDQSKSIQCRKVAMGEPIYTKKGNNLRVFVKTNSKKPFCLYAYNVRITLQANEKARGEFSGSFDVIVINTNALVMNMPVNKDVPIKMKAGESYNFLGFSTGKMATVQKARLKWSYKINVISPFAHRSIFLEKIAIGEIVMPGGTRNAKTTRLCPTNGRAVEIKNGEMAEFNVC